MTPNPGSTPREVWAGTDKHVEVETVSRCLIELHDAGDCSRVLDLTTRGTPFRYSAKAVTAQPPRTRAKAKQAPDEPWKTPHVAGSTGTIPGQSMGQGSVIGHRRNSMILGE